MRQISEKIPVLLLSSCERVAAESGILNSEPVLLNTPIAGMLSGLVQDYRHVS
jgi:hypothetical protein